MFGRHECDGSISPARTCTLILLCVALGGLFTLEQPSGSLLEFYPTWRYVLSMICESGGTSAVMHLHGNSSVLDICFDAAKNPQRSRAKHDDKIRTCNSCMRCVSYHRWFLHTHAQCCPYFQLEVTKVKWWMAHYGAKTAKRHIGFANSREVRRLDRGRLQINRSTKQKVKTCEKYQDRQGRQRYKGTVHLRGTEILDLV